MSSIAPNYFQISRHGTSKMIAHTIDKEAAYLNNLSRSKHNKMIAGVAGGMAENVNVDIALMRLI